ncbi:MAG TPA: glycosyltransferase [Bacteroidetes bacterium]|nr:glycosyltransferase [Bacteroidota bacterium]
MKKIALLTPAHPLRGGIAASSERLATELQNTGYEVVIYSFSLQYPGFLFPGKTQFTDDPAPGLVIFTKINSVNPLNWWQVGRELKKQKFDLLVSRFWLPFMGPCLGTVQRIAKQNGHTKTICIADNIIPHEARPGDRLFTQYFASSVDAFIAMSRSVLEDIKQFSGRPSLFVPHPIYDTYGKICGREEALAHLGLDSSFRYLLFFGFIRDYKGLDLLLHALADLRLRQMKTKLIIAGEYYGNREFYEKLIAELGIGGQLVIRSDYIPNEEVRYYFGAADLVVQPYKSATQSGISQMAYHFEKPMVVTDVGGLPEIVPHGKAGYVVPVDAQAIADAVFDFFQNNKMEVMARGVAEEKKRFSWSNLVEGIEELFEKISS